MLKKLTLAILLASALMACSKKNGPDPEEETPTGLNSTVFYADTFRVYKTDFTGGNRQLVVDEDISSGNNYIGYITTIPGKGQVVYTYTTGYLDGTTIRIVNADGTGKKTLKTIPAGTSVTFIKGVGSQVFYRTSTVTGTTYTIKTYTIDADGGNDKELTGIPNGGSWIYETMISSEGKGILDGSGYFMKLENGVFKEAESFYALSAAELDGVHDIAVSADASKVACLYRLSDHQYEIKVKDMSKTATLAKVYTVNLGELVRPVDILWVNGTKNIIVYYGKFTSPKGSPADFTQCELIDVAKGTATNWKFTGDQIGHIVVD